MDDEQENDVVVAENGFDQRDRLVAMVLDGVTSPHSRRAYETALNEFFSWWGAE